MPYHNHAPAFRAADLVLADDNGKELCHTPIVAWDIVRDQHSNPVAVPITCVDKDASFHTYARRFAQFV